MELLALGPVRAVVAGRAVDLGPPEQRALFALLLAAAYQRRARRLYGEHAPASVR